MTRTISNLEDQEFWIKVGEVMYTVRLYEFREIVYCDVKVGDSYIVCGTKVLPNRWIIPFKDSESGGNFRLETRRSDSAEYPKHDGFNTKFVFQSYSYDEIEAGV